MFPVAFVQRQINVSYNVNIIRMLDIIADDNGQIFTTIFQITAEILLMVSLLLLYFSETSGFSDPCIHTDLRKTKLQTDSQCSRFEKQPNVSRTATLEPNCNSHFIPLPERDKIVTWNQETNNDRSQFLSHLKSSHDVSSSKLKHKIDRRRYIHKRDQRKLIC